MKKHELGVWLVMLIALFGWTGAMTTSAQAATPLAIPDISEWQGPLSAAEVQRLKPEVAFVINRRQYGAGYVDKYATANTNLYVRYGIPFGEYDFSTFTSPQSAQLEARDFYQRSNKRARFYVLDFESNTVRSGTPNQAVDAWLQTMRGLTKKKLIFYSYAPFAVAYANQARQRFDAQWYAAYNPVGPTLPYALWQYTDQAHIAGIPVAVDNSRLNIRMHPLTWWTGATPVKVATVQVVMKPKQRVAVKPISQPVVKHPAVPVVIKAHRTATIQRGTRPIDVPLKRRQQRPRHVKLPVVKRTRTSQPGRLVKSKRSIKRAPSRRASHQNIKGRLVTQYRRSKVKQVVRGTVPRHHGRRQTVRS